MSLVRRQHFINQAYLEHFCDTSVSPAAIWLYDKKHDLWKDFDSYVPPSRTPNNLCVERDFYEGGDLPPNTLERYFSKIEGDFESLLQNKILQMKPLTTDDNKIIAHFLTITQSRTSAQKEHIEEFMDNIIEKVERMEKQHGVEPKESKKWRDSKQNKEMFIINIQQAESMKLHHQTSWMILVNSKFEDSHFITSDNPVATYDFALMNNFYGIPAFSKTTEITLPVTSKIAIIGNYVDISGYFDAHPNQIEEVNDRTLHRAKKEFYSCKRLEKAELHKLLQRNRQCLVLDKVAQKTETRIDKLVKQYERQKKRAVWLVDTFRLTELFLIYVRFRAWIGLPVELKRDEEEQHDF